MPDKAWMGEATCSRPRLRKRQNASCRRLISSMTDVLASLAENFLLQRLQKATRDPLPRAQVWDRRKGWEKMPRGFGNV